MEAQLKFETTDMLKEYFKLQKSSEIKFGNKTVVLYQVGSFYEIYEAEDKEHIGKSKEVGNVLNIQVTKKNKSKEHNGRNPYMIGFPVYAIDKFVHKLVSSDYTVVKVDQEILPDKSIERKVDKVYSPSTYLEGDVQNDNYILCIYLEKHININYANISAVDLTTGKSHVYETHDTKEDNTLVQNDIFRFLHSLNPVEILFNIDAKLSEESKEREEKRIINMYQLQHKLVHFREIKPAYKKLSYQNKLLGKVFSNKDTVTPIEYIGLTSYPDLVISFVALLQFAYEHDPSIIKKIKTPEIIFDDNCLILNNDSIFQLNLVSSTDSGKYSSLLKVVDFTLTNMGKRLLRYRILRPITNVKELEKRYDLVEKMIIYHKKYKDLLSNICDLEKKHRKAYLKKLSPYDFYMLTNSYEYILTLLKIIPELYCETKYSYLQKILKYFNGFYNDYNKMFDIDLMGDITTISSIQKSIFNKGIYIEIDNIQQEINENKEILEEIAEKYNNITNNDNKKGAAVKVQYTDKEGYFISTTTNKAKLIKLKNPEIIVTNTRSVAKIVSPLIIEISEKMRILEEDIGIVVRKKYIDTIQSLFKKYMKTLIKIIDIISEIDIAYSSAIASIKYVYKRPIINTKNENSYIEIKELRHPIIERIIDVPYQKNNICLGKDKTGMLLYGINSSGKSSFIRSLGCNIVLAQAGMYVAADSFEYNPYKMMISKISCSDNLFKGNSTFIAEMIELRNMINRSDQNTLILSDELCAGTESLSATSIVTSAMIQLDKKKSSYIFSTHLHTLMDISEVTDMEKLLIQHFSVHVDNNGDIKYDRKLKEGSGESRYGLEIAKTLNIGIEFIRKAFEIRAKLELKNNEILSTKTSRYNNDIYVHECSLCKKQELEVQLDTHHLKPQESAEKETNIIKGETFHKNVSYNLIILCKPCHIKVHQGIINIPGSDASTCSFYE
jgi:DNA mismatch repair protein MutS